MSAESNRVFILLSVVNHISEKYSIPLGVILISFLVFIDQIIKLVIANTVTLYSCCDYCIRIISDVEITLIPGFLYFEPILNAGFNIGLIMFLALFNIDISNVLQTPFIATIFTLIFLAIIPLSFRYCIYISKKKHNKLIFVVLIISISGAICSWIDSVFWGGSLDFLRLRNWFIFDIKDVYLTVCALFFLLWLILYYWHYYRVLSKEERKKEKQEIRIIKWIKQRCPLERQKDG